MSGMLNLIRLELKKMKIGWYFKSAVWINLAITALTVAIGVVEDQGKAGPFPTLNEVFIVIGALVRGSFIVMAAVLMGKFVIEEYKNKTIFVLFTYPISRKKLIAAKLLLICGLTFAAIVVSNLLTVSLFFVMNSFYTIVPGELTEELIMQNLASILTFALAATGTSLLPLYFGMRKQSVSAAIVSSVVIVMLISAHNPVFSVASIVYFPLALAAVGVLFAVWSIRNIEKVDVW